MIRVTLSKDLYRTFATDDIHLAPSGIIENVVGITHGGQCTNDSSRSCIQNHQPGGYSTSSEKPFARIV